MQGFWPPTDPEEIDMDTGMRYPLRKNQARRRP